MFQSFEVKTSGGVELIDITASVQEAVQRTGLREGICHIFIPHTTAAVTINENADPAVVEDLLKALDELVPKNGRYRHVEGNSAAHIKSTLVGCSKNVLIASGKLVLGTWQSIFFCEFDGPRSRKVHVQVTREGGLG